MRGLQTRPRHVYWGGPRAGGELTLRLFRGVVRDWDWHAPDPDGGWQGLHVSWSLDDRGQHVRVWLPRFREGIAQYGEGEVIVSWEGGDVVVRRPALRVASLFPEREPEAPPAVARRALQAVADALDVSIARLSVTRPAMDSTGLPGSGR